MKKKCCCCLIILFKYKKFTGDDHIHVHIQGTIILKSYYGRWSYYEKQNISVVLYLCLNVKFIPGDDHIHSIMKNMKDFTDQKGFILNTMMLSLSFPANIKYSPKTLILFFFIGVQTKFFLRGCWTRLDIINRRLGATSSSWVHCTFSQTSCCKNDFRNVSRILSLSCLVHLVEYARIHSFL